MNLSRLHPLVGLVIFGIACVLHSSAADAATTPDPSIRDVRAELDSARANCADPIRHNEEFWPDAAPLGGARRGSGAGLRGCTAARRRLHSRAIARVAGVGGTRSRARARIGARARGHAQNKRLFYSSLLRRTREEGCFVRGATSRPGAEGWGGKNAIRAVVDAWAAADFSAAFVWARALPSTDDCAGGERVGLDGARGKRAVPRIFVGSGKSQEPRAERAWSAAAVRSVMTTDPDAAAGLVMTLPASEARTLAVVDVARALASRDPRAGLRIGLG